MNKVPVPSLVEDSSSGHRVTARQTVFGTLPDGRSVPAVTLANQAGLSATVIAFGATLQSVTLFGEDGCPLELTLGHTTIDPYAASSQYFGSTVGRYANRIASGRFFIEGASIQIPPNNGPNALHGGPIGLDKALWDIVDVSIEPSKAAVSLSCISPDGDQGFPGTLTISATYSLDEQSRLRIDYRASTDQTTVVNLSNHAYWNLAGEASSHGAMDHLLMIPAATYLPVDALLIPTGERRPVARSPFDFRQPHTIGKRIRESDDAQIKFGRGYDHNWIVADRVTGDLHLTARLADPKSGRGFELWSNQPGLQFYSGNFLDGTIPGRNGRLYRQGDGLVLEPQLFPDTVNQPDFPSATLEPGGEYHHVIEYRFFQREHRRPGLEGS